MTTMVTSTRVTNSTSTTSSNLIENQKTKTRTVSTSSSASTIDDLENNGHYFPSLYELVDNLTSLDCTNETLSSFYNFLLTRHCPENLQFILDINNYLYLYNSTTSTRIELLRSWQFLYDKYLTFEADLEINLPCTLKSKLSMVELPNFEILSQCKKHIYDDLLINLYKEFTKQYHNDSYRHCLCKEIKHHKHHSPSPSPPPAPVQYHHHNHHSSPPKVNHHNHHSSPPKVNHHHSQSTIQSQLQRPGQSLKHTLSLNLPHKSKDENVCPIEKVTPITSPLSHKEAGDLHLCNNTQHHPQHHQHHHHHHTKQYSGYDYYTIPSTESSSEEEHSDGTTTKNNSRNGSTSSTSRGSSIGSIVDSSVVYFNKMKNFKFTRRFSNDQ